MNFLTDTTRRVLRRMRLRRQDFAAYAALVATPGDLAAGFDLPAPAELFVKTTTAIAATTLLIDVDSVAKGVKYSGTAPTAKVEDPHHVGRYETGSSVVKHTGAPGTVSLYIRDPAGALIKIGEG